MAAGKPNLVTPSLAKLDLEALKRDNSKFRQNLPAAASDAWEEWLDKIDELTFVPDEYDWPVEQLKNAVRAEPAPPAAQLPADLLELREKEIQPTREVSTSYVHNKKIFCIQSS